MLMQTDRPTHAEIMAEWKADRAHYERMIALEKAKIPRLEKELKGHREDHAKAAEDEDTCARGAAAGNRKAQLDLSTKREKLSAAAGQVWSDEQQIRERHRQIEHFEALIARMEEERPTVDQKKLDRLLAEIDAERAATEKQRQARQVEVGRIARALAEEVTSRFPWARK